MIGILDDFPHLLSANEVPAAGSRKLEIRNRSYLHNVRNTQIYRMIHLGRARIIFFADKK
jgi:hypothetical protein